MAYEDERAKFVAILGIEDDSNLSLSDLQYLVFHRNTVKSDTLASAITPVEDLPYATPRGNWADDDSRPTVVAEGSVVIGFNADTGNLDVGIGGEDDVPIWYNATLVAE